MVDWQTLYLKAQSRRPLLRCAEMLPLVMSPSRRSVGAAKVSKELKRQGLPSIRPFTVEVKLRLWPSQEPPGEKGCKQPSVMTRRPGYDDKSVSGRRKNRSSTGQ